MENPRGADEYPKIVYLLQEAFLKQGVEVTSQEVYVAWQDVSYGLGLDHHE